MEFLWMILIGMIAGWLPNVVYSCGALIHNNALIIPYAMSDINSGIATVDVKELLNSMRAVA